MEKRIAQIMKKSKVTIYLEPRSVFDSAIVDTENIIYDFKLLIDIIMNYEECTFLSALNTYYYNIECLTNMGLMIENCDYYEKD